MRTLVYKKPTSFYSDYITVLITISEAVSYGDHLRFSFACK